VDEVKKGGSLGEEDCSNKEAFIIRPEKSRPEGNAKKEKFGRALGGNTPARPGKAQATLEGVERAGLKRPWRDSLGFAVETGGRGGGERLFENPEGVVL